MSNRIDSVVDFFQSRVDRYGAPYYAFAIFGIINYPLAFIFEYYSEDLSNDSLYIRMLATVLCIILLLKDFWPKNCKRFLPLYWYSTVTISVPILATFLLLKNSGSMWWLLNFINAELIMVLILDWMMFIATFAVGLLLGLALYVSVYQELTWHASSHDTLLALNMYIGVYILCTLFARNKEMYTAKLLMIKDQLNEELEQEVIQRTNKLEEAVNNKNYFINNVTHEIRTYVQIISSLASSLLSSNKASKAEKTTMVTKIKYSSDSLFGLINNVLDLSKFESGKMLFDMKVHNMEDVAKDVIEELNFLAKEKNITIELYKNRYIETRSIFDKARISQVLRNLISNAIKYSKENGVIRVDLKQKYATLESGITINGLCISVRDEGIAIPKGELKKIFEPFTQSTKSRYVQADTGLGLSISADIVSSHSGVIWAENNAQKKGSTFYCVLPYPNNRLSPDEDKSETQKYRILFVDDEEGCRTAGRMMLENIGYTVKTFESGSELIDYLKYTSEKVDLILLDLLMPEISGIDLIKKLRSQHEYKKLPIILQTGVKYESRLVELEKYQPIGYISKPYNKETLNAEIQKYILKEKTLAL